MTKAGKEYYEPLPVDFAILELLPEIGTVGGVHWKGRRVKDVRDELRSKELEVDSALIQSRMRSMRIAGHVKHFASSTGGLKVWAITGKGKKFLATKEEELRG